MRYLISALILLIMTSVSAQAETVFHRAAQTGVSEVIINDYARVNSTIVLDHQDPANKTSARATLVCGADGSNRWSVKDFNGTCPTSAEVCAEIPTSYFMTLYAEYFSKLDLTRTEGSLGTPTMTVCMNASGSAGASGANVDIEEFTKCAPNAMLAPQSKGLCVWDKNSPAQITADTGDDMFKMLPVSGAGNGAFIEYPVLGDLDHPLRLRWIERGAGGKADKAIMIPSGPPDSYKDYELFMNNPPMDVARTEPACYPVKASICAGAQGPVDDVFPLPGLCGKAKNKTYLSIEEVSAAGLCDMGNASSVQIVDDKFVWSCAATVEDLSGASCSAKVDVAANGENPSGPGVPTPDDQCYVQVLNFAPSEPPCTSSNNDTSYCLGFANGIVRSTRDDVVGAGEYPYMVPSAALFTNPPHSTLNYPFLSSVGLGRMGAGSSWEMSGGFAHTGWGYQTLIVGPKAKVTIYDQQNFEGKVVVDTQGPLFMVNRPLQNAANLKKAWDGTNTPWPAPYNTLIPANRRIYTTQSSYSGIPMGSMKVTCDEPQSYWAYDTVSGMLQTIKLVWEGEVVYEALRRCPGCTSSSNRKWVSDGYPKVEKIDVGNWRYLRGKRVAVTVHNNATETTGHPYVTIPSSDISEYKEETNYIVSYGGSGPMRYGKGGVTYYEILREPTDGSNGTTVGFDDVVGKSCPVYAALADPTTDNPKWRFVADRGSGPKVAAAFTQGLKRTYSTSPSPYYNHPVVSGSISSQIARAQTVLYSGQTAKFVSAITHSPYKGKGTGAAYVIEDTVTCNDGTLSVNRGQRRQAQARQNDPQCTQNLGHWTINNTVMVVRQCLELSGFMN